MPSPLSNIAWEPCLLEPVRDPALEAYARRLSGFPQPSIRYFARVPWVARMHVDFVPDYGLLLQLDLSLADLLALVVSQENSCRYCYAAVRSMLRIQGMSEARVVLLEQRLARTEVEPRLAAAVRFARRMAHSNPRVGPADAQLLSEAGFSADEQREMAFAVAAMVLLNRLTTIAAVPPQDTEREPDLPAVRFLRPLIAWWLERHRVRGRLAPAPVDDGPWRNVVRPFAGSPIASLLSRTLTEMMDAPTLSLRCRLLLFAVIARGLGCAMSEAAMTTALEDDGLGAQDLRQALAHLDAPGLTDTERALLPFARDTLWYEPAQLQRTARDLALRLPADALTDAIGVVALANALCRLQMALDVVQN